MSQNYWPVGRKENNTHFRDLRDRQKSRRDSYIDRFKKICHGVEINIDSGIIVFAKR